MGHIFNIINICPMTPTMSLSFTNFISKEKGQVGPVSLNNNYNINYNYL